VRSTYRRHVHEGSRGSAKKISVFEAVAETKVNDLDVPRGIHHQILDLEVPVDKAVRVEVVHAGRDLSKHQFASVLWEARVVSLPVVAQVVEEISTAQVLRDEVHVAVVLKSIRAGEEEGRRRKVPED